MLSHRDGAHSHCGSSPRSLSPSDTYDSEGEGEAVRRRATAAALLAALPVPGAAPARAEDDLEPFGSLVLDGRESPLAAAVAAEGGAPTGPTAGPPARAGSGGSLPGSPRLGPGSVPPSVASSPRSSYEHPSSHASRHDLYSLSQVRAVALLWRAIWAGAAQCLPAACMHACMHAASCTQHVHCLFLRVRCKLAAGHSCLNACAVLVVPFSAAPHSATHFVKAEVHAAPFRHLCFAGRPPI